MAATVAFAADHPKRYVSISWRSVDAQAPNISITKPIDKKSPVSFTRIAPDALFELPVDIITHASTLPAHAPLARSDSNGSLYCEPTRRRKQAVFLCLEDQDSDGKLETYYAILANDTLFRWPTMESRNYEYFIGEFRLGPGHALRQPIALSSLQPARPFAPLGVHIEQTRGGFALCVHRLEGKDIWGGQIDDQLCGPSWFVRDKDLPLSKAIDGGQLTFTRTGDGQMLVKVVSPPAGQPFNP